MLAAFAGIVHDRQSADRHQQTAVRTNAKEAFIYDLATARSQSPPAEFSRFKMNPQ
jgi:hypothetical protein